jgi:hypothetical protein
MSKRGHTKRMEKTAPPHVASISQQVPAVPPVAADPRAEMMKIFEGLGAFFIASRADKIAVGLEALHKQGRAAILMDQMDTWVAEFHEHYNRVEEIIGPGLQLSGSNIPGEIKQKVIKAGYKSAHEFAHDALVPLVSFQSLIQFVVRQMGVPLPKGQEASVGLRMGTVDQLVAATGAKLLQESMGL